MSLASKVLFRLGLLLLITLMLRPRGVELLDEGKFVNSLQWNAEGERALIGARSGGDVFLMEYDAMANELEALPYSSRNNRPQYWDQAGSYGYFCLDNTPLTSGPTDLYNPQPACHECRRLRCLRLPGWLQRGTRAAAANGSLA